MNEVNAKFNRACNACKVTLLYLFSFTLLLQVTVLFNALFGGKLYIFSANIIDENKANHYVR